MPNNFPTGSVTGRREWEWTQWQAERGTRGGTAGPTDRQSAGRPDSQEPHRRRQNVRLSQQTEESSAGPEHRERRLRRIIAELEAKLEEREQRIQYIIRHYERLLSEKDRQLAAERTAGSTTDSRLSVLSKVRQYVVGH